MIAEVRSESGAAVTIEDSAAPETIETENPCPEEENRSEATHFFPPGTNLPSGSIGR
jgi:hypothetical protein